MAIIKVQTAYRLRALATGDQVGPFEIAWSNEFGPHALLNVPDDWDDAQIDAAMRDLERKGDIVRDAKGLWRREYTFRPTWLEDWVSFSLNPLWEIGDWRPLMGIDGRTQERGKYGRGKRVLHGDTEVDPNCPAFKNIRVTRGGGAGQTKDHGTHTASTVCGEFSAAPEAELITYNMLPGQGGVGSEQGIAQGIDWLTERGEPGDVATYSLGAPQISGAITQAINRQKAKRIHVFCAAGNSGGRAALGSPANAATWIVQSCTRERTRSTFTDGPQWPNLRNRVYGIGDPIVAFFPGGIQGEAKGTSMATPTAAGCAVLLSAGGVYIPHTWQTGELAA